MLVKICSARVQMAAAANLRHESVPNQCISSSRPSEGTDQRDQEDQKDQREERESRDSKDIRVRSALLREPLEAK